MSEIWKAIPDYDGYEVSTLGQVSSSKQGTSRILKHAVSTDGYARIALIGNDGKRKSLYVHRLVLLTHRPYHQEVQSIVDHIDGNKLNNITDNLRWVTQSENVANQNTLPVRGKSVLQIDPESGETIAEFSNCVEASKHVNSSSNQISMAACGTRVKTAGGYKWAWKIKPPPSLTSDEEFKPVVIPDLNLDFTNYQATKSGIIKHRSGRILANQLSSGYPNVCLCKYVKNLKFRSGSISTLLLHIFTFKVEHPTNISSITLMKIRLISMRLI